MNWIRFGSNPNIEYYYTNEGWETTLHNGKWQTYHPALGEPVELASFNEAKEWAERAEAMRTNANTRKRGLL